MTPIRSRISARRPAGMIARRQAARREAAAEAYEKWERAATAGLEHYVVERLWESYLRLAAIAR